MERYDLNTVPNASNEAAGVLRVANEVDEKNCGCKDAAITPSNLYSLLDCRKANTAYTAGAIVSCPYHKEFLLKCTTGGTTSENSIDTTAVTKGSTITDGSVVWTVIASQIIDIDISGTVITVTFIDGTQKALTTQDTNTTNTTSIMPNYSAGTSYTVGSAVSADGWIFAYCASGKARLDLQLKVNGVMISDEYVDIGDSRATAFFPVTKGDKVTRGTGSYSSITYRFFPCKG